MYVKFERFSISPSRFWHIRNGILVFFLQKKEKKKDRRKLKKERRKKKKGI